MLVLLLLVLLLLVQAQTHRGCRFKGILAEGSKAQKHFVLRLEVILGRGSKAFCLCLPRLKRPKNILGQGSKGAQVPAEVLVEVLAELPAEVL